MNHCEWVSDVFVVSLTSKYGLKIFFRNNPAVEKQLIGFSQKYYHVHIYKGFKYTFCCECLSKTHRIYKTFSQENIMANESISII